MAKYPGIRLQRDSLYTYGIKLGNLDLFKFMQIVAIGFSNHGTKKTKILLKQ